MGIAPALIALTSTLALMAWVERIGGRRGRAWASVLSDGTGEISQGIFIVKAKVVSDDRATVNLGNSAEKQTELSAAPDLISDGFTVELPSGTRLMVRAGTKLKTFGIVGAERTFVRAITGDTGIESLFSFSLKTGSEIYLLASTTHRIVPPTDGPFRSSFSYPVDPVEPEGGAVYLSGKVPEQWVTGCTTPLVVVLLLLAIPAALLGYGTFLTGVLVLGVLLLGMQWITLPRVPPVAVLAHAAELEAKGVRVQVARDDAAPATEEVKRSDHSRATRKR